VKTERIKFYHFQDQDPYFVFQFLGRVMKMNKILLGTVIASGLYFPVSSELCLQSCSADNVLTAEKLQKCVNKCFEQGSCCGNRLNGEDTESSNQRLSCANGCEIAYYSTDVAQCKWHCDESGDQQGCEYKHPLIKTFGKCGVDCSANCDGWPKVSACSDGCELAESLEDFYEYDDDDDSCQTDDIPRFLFAGQSNMVGNSNQNIEGLFDDLVDALNTKKSKKKQINKMKKLIMETDAITTLTAKNEAKFMYDIKKYMKENKITQDHKKIICSFTNPNEQSQLDCERPVSPEACGADDGYGPELMFAHAFSKLKGPYKGKKVGVVKVAEGGTEISDNWMKGNNGVGKNHWQFLADTIKAAKGSIEAFVWFQGENDSFDDWNRDNYLTNLTEFVSDVRDEIFEVSTGKFSQPSDIPVIIVELGGWIYFDVSKTVVEAQRTFVANDPKALLVETGGSDNEKKQLSKFYHFDSASLLIIGYRIAKKLKKLLQ